MRIFRTLSLLLLCAASFRPLLAADASIEERLSRLERELLSLREENSTLRQQLGVTSSGNAQPAAFVRASGRETRFALGGFSQINAEFGGAPDSRWAGANAADRFLLRRARLGVQAQWSEPVSFRLEADFGNNSIGGRSGYSAQLTDAFVTYARSKALNVRAGQFKTPFGFEQLTSDTRTHTVERSLPNDRLTLGRQIGLGVFGDLAGGKLAYSTGVYNGNGANNGANDNDNMLAVGRLSGTALSTKLGDVPATLTLGANGFVTNAAGTGFTGDRRGWGFDAQFVRGGWEFNAELLGQTAEPLTGRTIRSLGWSVLAAWTLPSAPAWRTVARFESYEADTDLADTTSENVVFGVVYRLKGDDLKLSFNYVLGDPAGPVSSEGRFLTSAQIIY